jgi:hypothetical protein
MESDDELALLQLSQVLPASNTEQGVVNTEDVPRLKPRILLDKTQVNII